MTNGRLCLQFLSFNGINCIYECSPFSLLSLYFLSFLISLAKILKNQSLLEFVKSIASFLYLTFVYLVVAFNSELAVNVIEPKFLAFFFMFQFARIIVDLLEWNYASSYKRNQSQHSVLCASFVRNFDAACVFV